MLDHLRTPWYARVAFRSSTPERPHFIRRNIVDPLRRGRRRRAALSDLQSLTDHQLADIGISRNDIPRVVEQLISADAQALAPIAAIDEPSDQLRRAA